MECFENSTESRAELEDESGFQELNTVHSASFGETDAAVDAAVRAAVSTADADEGLGSAVVALEGMDPTAATITVVSSLLRRRNPDRTPKRKAPYELCCCSTACLHCPRTR